jgi:hypothetical protein
MSSLNGNIPLETVGNFFAPEHTDGPPYIFAIMETEVVWNEGLIQMPVAKAPGPFRYSNPNPCKIVRAHSAVGQFIVRWMASREGDWPSVPDPRSANDNLTLLDARFISRHPKLNTAGVIRNYKVRGTYVYAFTQPVFPPQVGLWGGWVAYDSINPAANFMSASQFKPVY